MSMYDSYNESDICLAFKKWIYFLGHRKSNCYQASTNCLRALYWWVWYDGDLGFVEFVGDMQNWGTVTYEWATVETLCERVRVFLTDMLMYSSETNSYQLNVAMLTWRWSIASYIHLRHGCRRLSSSGLSPSLLFLATTTAEHQNYCLFILKKKNKSLKLVWPHCSSLTVICLSLFWGIFATYSTVVIIIIIQKQDTC